MKKIEKCSWEDYVSHKGMYMPDEKFIQVYHVMMRKIVHDTNLQCLGLFNILLSHRNGRGECYPSLELLAFECCVSVKTVQRMLDELEKAGFIEKISGAQSRTNQYKFNMITRKSQCEDKEYEDIDTAISKSNGRKLSKFFED